MGRNDADGDGKVTQDEFTGPPDGFSRMDSNGDGVISADEAANRPSRGKNPNCHR